MEQGKGRKPEPRLVPLEDEVGLDGQALLHDPPRVVHMAVEGAVGEVDDLGPVELPFGLEVEQGLLDRFQRHRPVHGIFHHGIGLQVQGLRPGQDESVVMGLVAVPVHQHDVARPGDRLNHDLVGGGGAVGSEISPLGAEGPGGLILGHLDVPGRFEQAVQAPGGGR